MTSRRYPGVPRAILGTVAVLAIATGAFAQLSYPVVTNSSNPNEVVPGTAAAPSRERQSMVEVIASSAIGAFTTRYSSLISVDSDGAGAGGGVESMASDYQVDFDVTAPGAYVLTVATTLSGDMHLVDDGSSATADVGPISGFSTGGTFASGTLGIADPGIIGAPGGGAASLADGSSATIFGVSNGVSVAHNLHFAFTQVVTSATAGGDEAAIRLGIASSIASETAGDYPGSPARTQSADGHFVTVTLTSLCGNDTIDSGPSYTEDCDAGPANGQPGSCCSSTCTVVTDSTPCDDGDACTNPDSCLSGVCTPGATATCPLCETCDGNGGCTVAPRPSCKLTTVRFQASLQLKDRTPDTGDQVKFKWAKGAATSVADFGSPTATDGDGYALCIFAPGRVLQVDAPAEGVCGTAQCWKTRSVKGFTYKDSLRTPNGVDKISLLAGLAGKAKVQLVGKGDNLPTLPLPLPLPATAQLQSENGQCWEGYFTDAGQSVNVATQFKGKAD